MLVPNFLKAFEGLDPAMQGYKKLVLIQLSGGNDGLNTIAPTEMTGTTNTDLNFNFKR